MASPISLHVAFNRLPRMRSTLTAQIRNNVHVWRGHHTPPFYPGYMRDHIGAAAAAMRNGVITSVIHSSAPYSAFEELRHHKIAEAVDAYAGTYRSNMARHVTEALR
jgi:hypothetical protein